MIKRFLQLKEEKTINFPRYHYTRIYNTKERTYIVIACTDRIGEKNTYLLEAKSE